MSKEELKLHKAPELNELGDPWNANEMGTMIELRSFLYVLSNYRARFRVEESSIGKVQCSFEIDWDSRVNIPTIYQIVKRNKSMVIIPRRSSMDVFAELSCRGR